MNNEEIIERIRVEKWARHRETDKREAMIDQYEKENRKLTKDELEKVRKMYNNYIDDGKEFKFEYIAMILDYNERCRHESIDCEVEKRGCKGCYYKDDER